MRGAQINIARAYARSIIGLGEERNFDIAAELLSFDQLISSSNDLESLLFLGIFTAQEKKNVLEKLFEINKVSDLLRNVFYFLIEEKRIQLYPLIFKEVTVLDDLKKGFIVTKIEGIFEDLPKDHEAKILQFLTSKLDRRPKVHYKKNNEILAGYKVTAEDLQLDASLNTQFDQLKKDIIGD